MGLGVNATYDCGYFESDLSLGGNMDGTCMLFPALCRQCGRIVTVDVAQQSASCPFCRGSDVVRYDAPSLSADTKAGEAVQWGADVLRDSAYFCPKCGEYNLGFAGSGDFFD